jgi:uncharacterized protein (DUF305 family)
MKVRTIGFTTILVSLALTVTGCTINIGSTADNRHGMPHQQVLGEFSNTDVMFAQMMIPHHQQAVAMGTLAETRAKDAEVKVLAAQIKSEQAPEITQMKGWLQSANAGMDMGHDMGMEGMLSQEDFAALEKATGPEFDRLFVAGMIAHHDGAVEMAKMVLNSSNAEAKTLGETIVESQTKQIADLKAILKRLG